MFADPEFNNSDVNNLTNNDKSFWAMGNCCLTANFKNETNNQTCLGEAMVRAANKGAFGYIGSVPESYWYEDYYFDVGATSTFGKMPTQEQTARGAYDALFDDTGFNTLNAVPYCGNVAVSYAYAGPYTKSSGCSEEYYWRAYQCFGDGSVMPYLKEPAANNVSHDNVIVEGTNSFTVNADGGSYVSITVDNEIIGVAAVPANATSVDVPFTTTPVKGTAAMIVVTRNQRQPYIKDNVPVIANNAPQYAISAIANPAEGGTISGGRTYYEGTNCTLTATANSGYGFTNWTLDGTEVSTDATYTFVVSSEATYTANFHVLVPHAVTYTPQQVHGTISVSPGSATAGEVVTLTAMADAGYVLDHWDVNTVANGNVEVVNNQFVMPDCEVTVSATFKREAINLTVYENETSTSQYVPLYGYNGDYYQKTEFVIPATELTNMVGGSISEMKFYISGAAPTKVWGPFEVFLKEVNLTSISGWQGTEGATTVYTGTFDGTSGTVTMTFNGDTPTYTYNGGNLLVGVYLTTTDGQWNSANWYGKTVTGASGNGDNNNSLESCSFTQRNFVPRTTFTYFPAENFCARPTNLHIVGEIGPKSVTVGWDAAGSDLFEYALVSGHNIDPTTVTYAGTTDNSEMSWNNLTADTYYTVVIRRKCDDDNFSQATTLEFRTAVSCPSPTLALVENSETTQGASVSWTGFSDSYILEYGEGTPSGEALSEGFEGGKMPDGWSATGSYWKVGSGTGHGSYTGSATGSYNATCYINTGNSTSDILITPSMNLGSVISATLSFNYRNVAWNNDIDEFHVYYRVNGGEWNEIYSNLTAQASWTTEPITVNLTGLANNYQIGFECRTGSGSTAYGYGMGIDDVKVIVENPSFAWTTVSSDAESPYTFSGLASNTTYTVRVTGDCGDGQSEPSNIVSFTTLETCPTPSNLTVDPSSITSHGASLSWMADNDSYNIMLGERTYLVNADFESGDLSGLGTITNDATYPWVITTAKNHTEGGSYSMMSGNKDKHSSTSSIEVSVNLAIDGTLSFYCWASCESASSLWDYGIFYIDGNQKDTFLNVTDWVEKSYNLTAGQHTLKWTYLKDTSVSNNDDCFYVDDIKITGEPHVLATYTSDTNSYDLTGLTGETEYTVQVQGVCGNATTAWSEAVSFKTPISCTAPTGLTADTPDTHSVELSWTENGGATQWQICVNDDESNLMLVSSNPYTLTGLAIGTEYTAKVRAYCDEEDHSIWSNTVTFETDSNYPGPTNVTISDLAATHATVSWDSEAGNYTVKYSTATVTDTTFDPIFEDGFENGMGNWTIYARGYDDSAYNWLQYDGTSVDEGNHTGDYVAASRSWLSSNGDQSVDNWLVTPQMTLGDVVKFWVACNDGYRDSYAVYVSTGSNVVTSSTSIGDFVLVKSYAEATGTWTEISVDISAYAGQQGYVAIRHTNYGGDHILIDDFGVYNTINTYSYGGWTTISPNPTTNSCQLTGLSAETLYEVQVQANWGGTDGSSAWSSVWFTTPDNCGAPQELASSNVTANSATLSWADDKDSYNLQYRKVYYYEDFEDSDGIPTGWTTINNNTTAGSLNWQVLHLNNHSGNNSVSSGSYIYHNSDITPDNWLISPQLDLQGTLRVWLSGYGDRYEEHFEILLSTTGTSVSDFTTTLVAESTTTNEYVEYTADLSSYSGQGYIAIHHFNCSDQNYLCVDDFGIYGSENWVALNPNPTTETANLTGLTPNTGYEWQVQGVNCDGNGGTTEWSEVSTFTTLVLNLELADNDSQMEDDEKNTALISANANQKADVVLAERTLWKDGYWNTLCLPFSVSVLEGSPLEDATVKELDLSTTGYGNPTGLDTESGTLYLNFKDATSISAGVPYIIKWTGGDHIVSPVFTGVTVIGDSPADHAVTFEGGKFVGTYSYNEYTEKNTSILFLGGNNELYWPQPAHSDPNNEASEMVYPSIGAFRAYFQLDDGTLARQFMLNFGGGAKSQGIVSLTPNSSRGGEGSIYTLNGVKLDKMPTRKGVYIRNGRKVVIK